MQKEYSADKKKKRSVLFYLAGLLYFAAACYFLARSIYDEGCTGLTIIGIAEMAIFILIWISKIRVSGVIGAVQIPITAVLSFFLLESFTHDPWTMWISPMLLNIVFFIIAVVMIGAVIGNFSVGMQLSLILFCFIGIANYYTMEFRGNPILPWDLYSIRVAASVTDNYTFSVTPRIAFIVTTFVLMAAFASKNTIRFSGKKIRAVLAVAGVLLLFGFKSVLGISTFTDQFLTAGNLFTQWATYRDNGFMVSFFQNLKYLDIEKPEGYSRERADEIVAEAAGAYDEANSFRQSLEITDDTEYPDILVIMNESFSDLAVLHEFGVSEDYMPYTHLLMESEEVKSGSLYVSVVGGNTANSEYEFLTGNTLAFLPSGSVAYQQYIYSDLATIAFDLKTLGYQTMASHPYNSTGWNRNKVYPLMQFDQMYFKKDMSNLSILRKYVSDESYYRFLSEKLDSTKLQESENGPIFSFAVTMQNHGGYSDIFENAPILIHLTDIDRAATENYLSLIRRSDDALRDLLTELEERERPTVVVFFGDHQPNDYVAGVIQRLDGKTDDTRTLEERQNRYEVPYLIWANYPLTDTETETLSVNYLAAKAMEAAGIPLSDHEKYLLMLQKEIPAITGNMYLDSDGVMHSTSQISEEDEEILRDYEIVCYRYLFDQDGLLD